MITDELKEPIAYDSHVDDHAQKVSAKQVLLLFQQTTPAFSATLFNALMLVLVLWEHTSKKLLITWLIAVCLLTFIRLLFVKAYFRKKPSMDATEIWGKLFTAGVFLSGMLWGTAGGLFFIEDDAIYQLFLALILAGMMAGAVSSLSSYQSAYLFFAIPTILPYSYRAYLHGGNAHIAIAITAILFLCVLWVMSRQLHHMITDSLQLHFNNTNLLSHLIEIRNQQQIANQQLQAQVKERKQAEKALQQANDQLEQRVKERTEALIQSNHVLQQEKELFSVTLASIGDAVITTDASGKITYLNPAAELLTGWHNNNATSMPLHKVFQTEDVDMQQSVIGIPNHTIETYSKNQECTLVRKDKQTATISYSIAPIHDDEQNVHGTVLAFRDVTKQRNLAEKLAHQAAHDGLTGLLNRKEFESRLEKTLKSAHKNNVHTLLYLDLDQFKVVNDTCGHSAGDQLLVQIAALLQSKLRSRDTLARLGGDEFGIILEHCSQADAIQIAKTLRETVQDFRYQWQNKHFTIGVSIGLFPISQSGESLSKVLSEADSACYLAKESGRNCIHVYLPDDRGLVKRKREMQWFPRIQKAIREERLCLYFQPIMATHKDKWDKHGEILLRLRNEQGELVSPGAFLPSAERYNQMLIIDRWVVQQSFNFIKAEQQQQIKGIYAINLSAQALGSGDFLDFVVNNIKAHIKNPSSICFEVTENAALADLKSVILFVTTLKQLGCRFSMDDFGSGLSSFGYLRDIPIDYLKIDGRLVKDMTTDPIDLEMVQAIQNIGRIMGLETIAEWVENADTAQLLKEM